MFLHISKDFFQINHMALVSIFAIFVAQNVKKFQKSSSWPLSIFQVVNGGTVYSDWNLSQKDPEYQKNEFNSMHINQAPVQKITHEFF